jgi:hypothetical protein
MMSDFLDDLTGGFVDDDLGGHEQDKEPLRGCLVVGAKAESSEALNDEVEAYLLSTDGGRTPFVIFEEEDEEDPIEGPPVFANAREFQKAMGTLQPPTEAEALAWSRELIGERLAQWERFRRGSASDVGAMLKTFNVRDTGQN